MTEAREPGPLFECVATAAGELRPMDPGRARALAARRGECLVVREMTERELVSERQRGYWFGVVIPAIQECWKHAEPPFVDSKGRPRRIFTKEEVHASLMCAFGGGPVETPLGTSYPSSRFKSKKEFARITDEVRAYAWEEFESRIPEPDERLRGRVAA